ncbi:MAG: hypothetical protein NTX05_02010 [Fusobacteria bacterium]|nr:hypothetical protein [Fusobacteriota bacterium]
MLTTLQMMFNNMIAPENLCNIGAQAFLTPNPYCNIKTVSLDTSGVIYRSPKFYFYDNYGRLELIRTPHTETSIAGRLFPMFYNLKFGDIHQRCSS